MKTIATFRGAACAWGPRMGLTLILGIAGTSAGAQTTAPGPYYATPSWSQKLACDTAAACPRFVVLANWNSEAVLDRETGLVWQRSPAVRLLDQGSQRNECRFASTGGRRGWRMPSASEMSSLIDPASPLSPMLPPGHPFIDFGNGVYWTTTPWPWQQFGETYAVVNFMWRSGAPFADLPGMGTQFEARVLCVRAPTTGLE